MAKFVIQKLPPHWVIVPSKRAMRELLRRLGADVRLVEYVGTESWPKATHFSLGFLESRVADGGWRFYLRLWGVRESMVGAYREAAAQAVLAEIERYIHSCIRQRPADVIKPAQLYLSFEIKDGDVQSRCRVKIKDKYSFSTGDWWLDPVESPEHRA